MKTWSSLLSNYRTLEINPSIVVLLVALMEKIQIKINSTKQTRHSRRVDWSGGWWQKRLIVLLLLLSISYSATLEMLIVLNGQLYCSWFHNLLPSSTSFSLHNQMFLWQKKTILFINFLLFPYFTIFRFSIKVKSVHRMQWMSLLKLIFQDQRERRAFQFISIARYCDILRVTADDKVHSSRVWINFGQNMISKDQIMIK